MWPHVQQCGWVSNLKPYPFDITFLFSSPLSSLNLNSKHCWDFWCLFRFSFSSQNSYISARNFWHTVVSRVWWFLSTTNVLFFKLVFFLIFSGKLLSYWVHAHLLFFCFLFPVFSSHAVVAACYFCYCHGCLLLLQLLAVASLVKLTDFGAYVSEYVPNNFAYPKCGTWLHKTAYSIDEPHWSMEQCVY